jgi:hypothetical protein
MGPNISCYQVPCRWQDDDDDDFTPDARFGEEPLLHASPFPLQISLQGRPSSGFVVPKTLVTPVELQLYIGNMGGDGGGEGGGGDGRGDDTGPPMTASWHEEKQHSVAGIYAGARYSLTGKHIHEASHGHALRSKHLQARSGRQLQPEALQRSIAGSPSRYSVRRDTIREAGPARRRPSGFIDKVAALQPEEATFQEKKRVLFKFNPSAGVDCG